jgi:hypothetical protein
VNCFIQYASYDLNVSVWFLSNNILPWRVVHEPSTTTPVHSAVSRSLGYPEF